MNFSELKCGYCGFKGNTKEDYSCKVCDNDPWWEYIKYPETSNSSALDEFKAILDFETKRKNKSRAYTEYDSDEPEY